jgi:hypothetical protein
MFRSTLADLSDCLDVLYEDGADSLPEAEFRAYCLMIRECREFLKYAEEHSKAQYAEEESA